MMRTVRRARRPSRCRVVGISREVAMRPFLRVQFKCRRSCMKRSSASPPAWKKLLFGTAGVVAVAATVVVGVLNAPRCQPHLRADAQAPGAGRPAFEIASVKPNTSRDGQPGGNLTPGG